jgi:hypothetical protein
MTLLHSILSLVLWKYIVKLIFIVLYSSKRTYFGGERHLCMLILFKVWPWYLVTIGFSVFVWSLVSMNLVIK